MTTCLESATRKTASTKSKPVTRHTGKRPRKSSLTFSLLRPQTWAVIRANKRIGTVHKHGQSHIYSFRPARNSGQWDTLRIATAFYRADLVREC